MTTSRSVRVPNVVISTPRIHTTKPGWQRYLNQVRAAESRETGTALSGTVGLRISGGVIMDRGAECCTTFKAAQEVGNYEDVPVRPGRCRSAALHVAQRRGTTVLSDLRQRHCRRADVGHRGHVSEGVLGSPIPYDGRRPRARAPAGTPHRVVRRPRKVCNCDIKRDLLDWKALPGTAPDAIENCTAASGTPLKQSRSKSISTHASPSTTTSHYVTASTAAPRIPASALNHSAPGGRSRNTCARSCLPHDQRAPCSHSKHNPRA